MSVIRITCAIKKEVCQIIILSIHCVYEVFSHIRSLILDRSDKYYKNKYGHIRHFWQDRHKSIKISKDYYLLACGSYVELNPFRAGIVAYPTDYKWSSYKAYAYRAKDIIIDEHPIYKNLSNDKGEGHNSQVKY